MGPKFIHVFHVSAMVLPSQKSLTHDSGGVKVVVRGRGVLSIALVVDALVADMMPATLISMACVASTTPVPQEQGGKRGNGQFTEWIERLLG